MSDVRKLNIKTPMRDGVELSGELFLPPEGDGPFPTIIERTARYKERAFINPFFEFFASRGYAVLASNGADRWRAEGRVRPFFLPGFTDAEDGYDTVEWAAAQDWSNGMVGGIGYSYPAWCQWQLAALKPPHLRTIFVGGQAPRMTDWQMGGVYRIGRQLQWTIGPMASDTQDADWPEGPSSYAAYWHQKNEIDREKWLWYLPQKDLPAEMLGTMADRFSEWLDNLHIDLWKLHENCSKIDIPVFHRTSWYDRLGRSTELFTGMQTEAPSQATRDAQRMTIGPWSHIGQHDMPRKTGEVDFGPEAEVDVLQEWALPWFDHWLKGLDNGVLDTPPVRVFVMGANTWRNEQQWPLASEQRTDFFLHSAGKANTPRGDGALSTTAPADEEPDRFTYDPRNPVMTLYTFGAQDEPHDNRVLDHRRDVLVYQTEPLEEPIEVIGVPELILFASSSVVDTDFTVKLLDVWPDGFSQDLCYGIVRARFRDGFETQKLITPGETYEFRIELLPTGNLFKAGHRIRVDVSSSDFPNFDRNHNTGGDDYGEAELVTAHQTVFHDTARPSRLVLPVIPAA